MKKKPAPANNTKKHSRWLVPAITGGLFLVISIAAFYLNRPAPKLNENGSSVESVPAPLPSENISLPQPDLKSSTSIEASLKLRRTRRAFLDQSLTTKQVAQMLWAAQGVTSDWGGRTAPSAKSTYPLSVYLIVNKVEGLDPGQYFYLPGDRTPVHQLKPIKKGEFGEAIFTSLNQNSFKNVPAIVVLTGNMNKMSQAFGNTPQDKNVYLEAGHAAQNMYLQAESLKIGMVTNSSFQDNMIRNIVTIPEEETIIYLIPFGHPED